MARLEMVDDRTFAERVEGAEGLVVVDFTAAWCPPCRILAPVLEALAEAYAGAVRFVALDVDQNPATSGRFGVRGLPTLVFFRGGVEVGRSVGAVPRSVLAERIDTLLAEAAVR